MTKFKAYIKAIMDRKNSNYTVAQGVGSTVLAVATFATMAGIAEGETSKEDVKDNVAVYDKADATTDAYKNLIDELGFISAENIAAFQFLATLDAYEMDGKVPAAFQKFVDANNYKYIEKLAKPVRIARMNAYLGDPDKKISLTELLTNATEDQITLLNKAEECVNIVRQRYFSLGETDTMFNDQKARTAYDSFLELMRVARMVLTSGQYSMIFRDNVEMMYGFLTNDYAMYDHYSVAFEGMGAPNDYIILTDDVDPRMDTIIFRNEDLAVMYNEIADPCYTHGNR